MYLPPDNISEYNVFMSIIFLLNHVDQNSILQLKLQESIISFLSINLALYKYDVPIFLSSDLKEEMVQYGTCSSISYCTYNISKMDALHSSYAFELA